MKKIFVGLIILILFPCFSFGGGIKIQLQGGLGTYSMADMKDLNWLITRQVTLPLHQTDNFPPYWFYKGAFLFDITRNFSFGPMYAFHSTGSRYSLADYSGQYYFDDLIQAHSLGLTFNYLTATNFNLYWGFYMDGGISFSRVQFKEHLELAEVEDQMNENSYAKETSYFVEPGICFSYPLKFVEPGIHFGYLFPVSHSALKENESNQTLYLPAGEKAKTGWNGFRVSLAVTIPF